MATLVFSAVGTLVGGPLGGAIGALLGRQVDAAILGSPRREGARLKELAATTSSYGAPLPRHFGRMRVPGSIIWATDLVEHRDTEGGGKGKPKVTTYSYTASFAVALASRPIRRVDRIWADGNLLRGAAGDLKSAGAMRLHTGEEDQPADPLIAAFEGEARCPAWRGLAYVVFEDLELGDFFNRIPALTFEVIADEGPLSLQAVLDGVIDDSDAGLSLAGVDGLSGEGPLIETLRQLEPVFPMDCDACAEKLTIAPERRQESVLALPDAAVSGTDGDFGRLSGFARKRQPPAEDPPEILRYYDQDRDYQPGLQRAPGRPGPGQPRTVELPFALSAATARAFAERCARRSLWARETLAWRVAELDPAIVPGALVSVPGQAGTWRVREWEWRDSGIELSLERAPPGSLEALPPPPVDPGRASNAPDLPSAPTVLAAYELPWDGIGDGATPALHAAVSSPMAHWGGAAILVDRSDGQLRWLAGSGRGRSTIGAALDALPAASPLLFDRASSAMVQLIDPAMQLVDASGRQLALGANRALLGSEIIQFARAVPLGLGRWRLHDLLRGRGGTESALSSHAAGEPFVLLDSAPVTLDAAAVGAVPGTVIAAVGRGDSAPATSPIALAGITRRPLSPVHPRCQVDASGALSLSWTRRARGVWHWNDGVDAPLNEQHELYHIAYGTPQAAIATWQANQPRIDISAAQAAQLAAQLPGGAFVVRQLGSQSLSEPLELLRLD